MAVASLIAGVVLVLRWLWRDVPVTTAVGQTPVDAVPTDDDLMDDASADGVLVDVPTVVVVDWIGAVSLPLDLQTPPPPAPVEVSGEAVNDWRVVVVMLGVCMSFDAH